MQPHARGFQGWLGNTRSQERRENSFLEPPACTLVPDFCSPGCERVNSYCFNLLPHPLVCGHLSQHPGNLLQLVLEQNRRRGFLCKGLRGAGWVGDCFSWRLDSTRPHRRAPEHRVLLRDLCPLQQGQHSPEAWAHQLLTGLPGMGGVSWFSFAENFLGQGEDWGACERHEVLTLGATRRQVNQLEKGAGAG